MWPFSYVQVKMWGAVGQLQKIKVHSQILSPWDKNKMSLPVFKKSTINRSNLGGTTGTVTKKTKYNQNMNNYKGFIKMISFFITITDKVHWPL